MREFIEDHRKEVKLGILLGVLYVVFNFLSIYKDLSNFYTLLLVLSLVYAGYIGFKKKHNESIKFALIVAITGWIISDISLLLSIILDGKNIDSFISISLYSFISTLILAGLLGSFGGFLAERVIKRKK